MFNWTTTTVINSLEDFKNPGKRILLTSINGTEYAEVAAGGTIAATAKFFKIKRDFTFEPRYVKSIFQRSYSVGAKASLTFNLTKIATAMGNLTTGGVAWDSPAYGTINMYFRRYDEQHLYANDWYFKGKPFSIGFAWDGTKVTINVDELNRAQFHTFGERVFNFTPASGIADNTFTIDLLTEQMYLYKYAIVAVQNAWTEDERTLESGEGTKLVAATMLSAYTPAAVTFGDYNWILHNLRLPTPANTSIYRIMEDEMPIPGAIYDQYIVNYCAPSLANPGFSVIGQLDHNTASTHIFLVKRDDPTTENQDFLKFIKAINSGNDPIVTNTTASTGKSDKAQYTVGATTADHKALGAGGDGNTGNYDDDL